MAEKGNSKKTQKRDRIGRILAVIYAFALVGALAIVLKIAYLQTFYKMDPGIEAGVKASSQRVPVEPSRGRILSCDDRILAISVPRYTVSMDCSVRKKEFQDRGEKGARQEAEWRNKAKELSQELPKYFPGKSADEYYKMIISLRSNENAPGRRHRVLGTDVDYNTVQELKKLPLFREGANRGGFIAEEQLERLYPYGSLGRTVIGYIKTLDDKTTAKGLEGSFDQKLRGQIGYRWMRETDGRVRIPDSDSTFRDAKDGWDMRTTIDIDVQDMVDRALKEKIGDDEQVEGGTAILMEVKTGAIRAMVNLKRDSNGRLAEIYNYAVARADNPGSVFKAATLMNAIEDGYYKSSFETVPTNGGALKNYEQDRHILQYEQRTGKKAISLRDGLQMSSNYVFRYVALENYRSKPQSFTDKLSMYKFNEAYSGFDLDGMAKGHTATPNDKSWTPTDLGSIAIGYSMQETPLHIITFYNAIANGGKMMMPYLVEDFEKDGIVMERRGSRVLNASICSKATADTIRHALMTVAEDGGTATVMKNARCKVAGKTGTARGTLTAEDSPARAGKMEDELGRKRFQGTFVCMFPADEPKYTMLVTIYSRPTHSDYYGGNIPAKTVREVVDRIYSIDDAWREELHSSAGVSIMAIEDLSARSTSAGTVPDVTGLGLKDAIFTLENAGYTCTFTGVGHVASQSIAPGKTAKAGTEVSIVLK